MQTSYTRCIHDTPSILHNLDFLPQAIHDPSQVHRKQEIPLLINDLANRREPPSMRFTQHAGDVGRAVERAEFIDRLFYPGGDGGPVADVDGGGQESRGGGFGLDGFGGGGEGGGVDVGEGDGGAARG